MHDSGKSPCPISLTPPAAAARLDPGKNVPTISVFYGIVIAMYWGEHAPPHFHALYAEDEAIVDIRTLEIIRGGLPRRARALVLEWAHEHRDELSRNWDLCARNRQPTTIAPLS
jgi:hypothetical protein